MLDSEADSDNLEKPDASFSLVTEETQTEPCTNLSDDLSTTSYDSDPPESVASDTILMSPPQFSKSEIDAAYDDIMDGSGTPSDAMIPALMQEVSRRKIAALEEHKYELAREHDRVMSLLMQQLDQTSCAHAETLRQQALRDREDLLKKELDKVKDKWEEKMQKQSESSESRLRLLKEKHERELQEFRQKYKDPVFLQKFNRPSRDLLVMRRTEKKLALSKKYDEARRTKARADRLQAAEEQKMREVITQQIQLEYARLLENQKKEMERLLAFDNEMKAKLETHEAREVEPIKASLHGLDVRRGETVNKKMLAMTHIAQCRDQEGRGQALLTPRTRQRMKELRDRKTVEMSLKPITDTQFDKLEEMSRKRSRLPRLHSSMR